MSGFQKVARVDQIPEGHGIAVDVGGRRIAIFNSEGEFHAVEATCARHDAPLEKGAVEESVLHCPWHGVDFDLETGICSAFPDEVSGVPVAMKVEGDDILIDA